MKVVVRKASRFMQDYPLVVVAIHEGKDVSQEHFVRNRRDGLLFGNGMLSAFLVAGSYYVEDCNTQYDDDCAGIE